MNKFNNVNDTDDTLLECEFAKHIFKGNGGKPILCSPQITVYRH